MQQFQVADIPLQTLRDCPVHGSTEHIIRSIVDEITKQDAKRPHERRLISCMEELSAKFVEFLSFSTR